jgi:hypothetical protein
MMKTDADRGQAQLCPKARTHRRIWSPKPVAAWTQRACPQINNTCFQTNRAREQADANGSRDGYGANAKLRKRDGVGSNSAQALGSRQH